MNEEKIVRFMGKMLDAKKMELEALSQLMPERARGHFSVIGSEMKSMLMECLAAVLEERETPEEKNSKSGSVKKVNIL